jgi:hypothetical protein
MASLRCSFESQKAESKVFLSMTWKKSCKEFSLLSICEFFAIPIRYNRTIDRPFIDDRKSAGDPNHDTHDTDSVDDEYKRGQGSKLTINYNNSDAEQSIRPLKTTIFVGLRIKVAKVEGVKELY